MTYNAELREMLNHACHSSTLARNALLQENLYNQQIYVDQDYLLKQNNVLWSYQQNVTDIHYLQTQALARINKDISYIDMLNAKLSPYQVNEATGPTWALYTNKMHNILNHARELVSEENTFQSLIQGELPLGYDNHPPEVVILGDTSSLYGNSMITYLSAAIVEVNLSLRAQDSKVQDIPANEAGNLFVDHSAIVHVTPLPEFILNDGLDAHFTSDFSFYFSDNITPHGLAFIHSGYAFGGQRGEDRYYEESKTFGPEDCSSWIAKLCQSDFSFSTIDQLYTYRMGLPEDKRGYVDPNWLDSDGGKTMQVLSPVYVEDPLLDIQPGHIFAYRVFDSEDHENSSGRSGHTALVLGVRENGNVVTVGYSRDMPAMEGFGIKEYPWESSGIRETMFFSMTKPVLSIDDIITPDNKILGTIPNTPYFQNHFENLPIIEHNPHIEV